MKLLLVGNYLSDGQKSMNAYANMLYEGLIEAGIDVELVHPKRFFLPKNTTPIGVFKWIAYIDKFVLFPILLNFKTNKYTHIHICDHSNAMYVLSLDKQKVTITCHDVIAICAARGLIDGWHVGNMGRIFQQLILSGLLKAKKIFCVSDLTMRSLVELSPSVENKCVVIHNALNFDYRPDNNHNLILQEMGLEFLVQKEYVLHVGSDLPRKNRPAVLEIFKEMKTFKKFKNTHLLFVGPNLDLNMRETVNHYGLMNFVHIISDITQEQLRAIYSGSLLLIFPSSHEGFGWPISEAQACGCPVFASNIAPLPEVGGVAAKYFNPLLPEDAAKLIDSSDLVDMRINGFKNVEKFKPNIMIKNLISELK